MKDLCANYKCRACTPSVSGRAIRDITPGMRNQKRLLSIAAWAKNRICAHRRAHCILGAAAVLFLAILGGFTLAVPSTAQNFVDLKPTPQQVEWQDLEFGVIVHFGLNTYTDKEWGSGKVSPSVFNPTKFNPDQWVEAAKAAGAKYLVFVAKHHDGFCLFPDAADEVQRGQQPLGERPWRRGEGGGRSLPAART